MFRDYLLDNIFISGPQYVVVAEKMPIKTFEEVWNRIQGLAPGQEITIWSAAGRSHGHFSIVSVDREVVIVTTKQGTSHRQARKSYVEKVFEVWDDYCRGRIPRTALRSMTHNSTYIVSILRWAEN